MNVPASIVQWSAALMIHTLRVTLGYFNQEFDHFQSAVPA